MRKMLLRYYSESYYETKQAKLECFQYSISKKDMFYKTSCQEYNIRFTMKTTQLLKIFVVDEDNSTRSGYYPNEP